ncbi:MAG: LptF/LptG family permease [Parvularculales bacterium]
MTILDRYIIRQLMISFGFLTLILASVTWLTQTLKFLEISIKYNQGISVFFELALFYLPYIMTLILPAALLCASLYVLYRLRTDRELIIMLATGVNYWGFIRPVITFAGLIAILTLLINIYVSPASMRHNRDVMMEARSELVFSLVRAGQFMNPTIGITIYAQHKNPNGVINNILFQDERNPDERLTYIAQSGTLSIDGERSFLIMHNGSVQYSPTKSGVPPANTINFDQYSIDISNLIEENNDVNYNSRERFIQELLFLNANNLYENQQKNKFLARGHDHLTSPLFCFLYALIALATFLPGFHSRQENYTLRIAIGVSIAVVLRIAQLGLVSLSTRYPALLFTLYMLPLSACFITVLIIFAGGPSRLLSHLIQKITPPQEQGT